MGRSRLAPHAAKASTIEMAPRYIPGEAISLSGHADASGPGGGIRDAMWDSRSSSCWSWSYPSERLVRGM